MFAACFTLKKRPDRHVIKVAKYGDMPILKHHRKSELDPGMWVF